MLPRIALLRCLPTYSSTTFFSDLGAGILVGVVAIPLSIGLAIASGVSPAQGLTTAVVGGLLISLLGGSRVQIGGPAGAFVGLCAAGVAQYGYGGLALATLMAGLLILFLGLARLGKAISFIPVPVVIGFTTGIAVIIASTQLAPMLGVAEPAKPLDHVHGRLAWLWSNRASVAWQPLAVTLACIAIVTSIRRFSPKAPAALIAIIAVTLGCAALGWSGGTVATIGSRFGDLPSGIPMPSWPDFGLGPDWTVHGLLERMQQLSGLALAIALLGSIESLLSAVVADGLSGDRHHSNTELMAQGVANLATPFFGGLPCTGVIARTSTNIRAGGKTPVAGIIHALTVLLVMIACAPLVKHVPLAGLAGILLVVCFGMAELRHWPHILRAGRSDAFLLPMAFGLTVLIDLTWAVVVGVMLSMFFFVRRMVEATHVERLGSDSEIRPGSMAIPPGVVAYEIRGPFFFGAATLLRDLEADTGAHPRALILRLGHVPFIDATAAFALREMIASHRANGTAVVLCEIRGQAANDLVRHGLPELLGPDGLALDLPDALRRFSENGAGDARKPHVFMAQ